MKRYTLFALFSILLGACASKKQTATNVQRPPVRETAVLGVPANERKDMEVEQKNTIAEPSEDNTPEKTIKANARIDKFVKDSDPILGIDQVEIRNNKMFIRLQYGGGCTTHDFELIASPMIAKSYPPIRAIQLVHRANNDMCLAAVMATIEIDLEDISINKKDGYETAFTLEGWDGRILHTYTDKKE